MTNRHIKGVILAGGKGSRLKPLTDALDKPLLPINGRPMILYAVDKLVQAGIKDLIVVIQDRNAEQYQELLQNGEPVGANSVTFVRHPEESLGMPRAIGLVRHLVQKNEDIAVVCADVLMKGSMKPALEAFRLMSSGALILAHHVDDTASFSLLRTKDNKVVNIEPKRVDHHEAGLIDLGAGFYPHDVFKNIDMLYPAEKEVGITALNQIYASSGHLRFHEMKGGWSDAGKSLDHYNSIKKQPKVLILGAGLAGLSAALHLRKAGYDTTILEKEKIAGGLFTNSSVEGCDFDYGPKILLLDESENSKEMLKYLGSNFEKLPVLERVYLKEYGLLNYPLQRHLIDLPKELRETIIQDLEKTQQEQPQYSNFREWLISNFGRVFSEMILIPYEQKKWRIDLSQMDFRWALKRPVRVDLQEIIAGSKQQLPPNRWYYYPKDGNISTFTDKVIAEAGPILYDNEVIGLDLNRKVLRTKQEVLKYDTIISTIPLDYVANITSSIPLSLKKNGEKLLKRLSILVINLVYEGNFELDGTAIYFPEEDFIFRRVSVLQNLCPALARKGKTPISVEVSIDPKVPMSQAEVYKRALEDLAKIPQFAKMGRPIANETRFVDFAYPLQIRGHAQHIGELHRFYAEHDIYHCGRGGSYDYCNGDEAYYLGGLMAKRVIKNMSYAAQIKKDFSITVGIPSYKSGISIVNTVKSILASKTSRKIKIVVSVDGPTMDKQIENKLDDLGVTIIANDERQGQTARNAQIANLTRTDLLIMTQDDVVFTESTVDEIVKAFSKDKQLTMVAPSITPLPSENKFEDILRVGVNVVQNIASSWKNGDNYLSSVGRCLAYRTEMVQQFDVDEKIINCDAFYYFENKRIGGKFAFIPTAKVFYRLPQNLSDHMKQVRKFVVSQDEMNNYLRMDLQSEYTYPRSLFLKSLVSELIKNPIKTVQYLALSVYARKQPKSFYKEVTRFWDIDKSTKNT